MPQKRPSFRERYNELEVRRAELAARLHLLGEVAQRHPGYKRTLKLLNDIYRKEKLARRLAVLHAAAWLVELFPTRIRYSGLSLPYHIGDELRRRADLPA
jgi:hypothetical protein